MDTLSLIHEAAPGMSQGRAAHGARLLRRMSISLTVIAIVLSSAWAGGAIAAHEAQLQLGRRVQAAAELRAAMLRSELEKYQSLPFVLARDSDVSAAIESETADAAHRLSAKLEMLAQQTRAAAIYVIHRSGRTIASSNWRLPTSFVGVNYSFRPYFRDAMANGAADLFALGTVSLQPGLYLARRVQNAAQTLGVVVVKVKFDELERHWSASDEHAYVTDVKGVVLITDVPQWRFQPAPVVATAEAVTLMGAQRSQRFMTALTATAKPGWTLHLLAPIDQALKTAQTAGQMIGAASATLLLLGAVIALMRRARAREQAQRREASQRDLEARVAERTRDLQTANERLVFEMDERRRAEASLHTLQDELVQANKLAVLGQVTAGVAHEINQPVAAIRSYVDNASVLLGRGETTIARANLGRIAALTERIGLITQELRAFARKTSGAPRGVCVEEAVSGALLLVGARLRHRGVRLVREGDAARLWVLAERIRLEQVLVNLLQNAMDALQDASDAVIRLSVAADEAHLRIRVCDNGPGLAPDVARALFTPFVTTKPQGLGLGLVISRDIVAEFGGSLEYQPPAGGGAAFVITLRRAVETGPRRPVQ